MRAPCTGEPAQAFQTGKDASGVMLWRCSACEGLAPWYSGWGAISCPKEHEPCLNWVACSPGCEAKLGGPRPAPQDAPPRRITWNRKAKRRWVAEAADALEHLLRTKAPHV